MDTKVLEKFCPWARVELIDAVHLRCVRYALGDAGRAAHAADADVVNGTVLNPDEKTQRKALYEHIEELDEQRDGKGYAAFCEQQAYSWFNRFAAIRYMECHGFLSHGVRIFSNSEGKFEPDCLHMASELDLPGLDASEALDLMAAGDDEALFRRIIVAQCNDLAECLPTVFDHVDDAYALTLPDNLLGRGEHDVLFHLVTDIDESVWNPQEETELNVEVLGWMYQFYNSELKDAFFKSKRKAAVEDIAPATQLFTPDWIVRYMVENSLGRLWMLNNPESHLRERMAYYIEPDEEHEDFIHIAGPEDITFCDPACGSGHILVYAFNLLFDMYIERGYREREIPELILTKNLTGFEIDERAAQIASLALAMCARAHDRRFLTRGVTADIHVLSSIEIDVDALDPASALRQRPHLIEALAHLSEVGSLLCPSPEDLGALKSELMRNLSGDLFVSHTQANIERAEKSCEALSRTFDVVVANPPYMGSSSFNPFMSKWIKANYPDSCKDLCTAFIERQLSLVKIGGFASLVTSDTCMYLSSFEALRNKLIDNNTLLTLIDTRGSNAHPDVFDANAGWVVRHGQSKKYQGSYFKLNQKISEKGDALIEAIQNPDCGWFYRADATTFHDIPGSPIAYWASEAVHNAFRNGLHFDAVSHPKVGMQTSNNEKYLRLWWESDFLSCSLDKKWIKYLKGGSYRKWYGNLDWLLLYKNDPSWILRQPNAKVLSEDFLSKPKITWTDLTSGANSFRSTPIDTFYDISGHCYFPKPGDEEKLIAYSNSSVFSTLLAMFNSTMHCQVGDVARMPYLEPSTQLATVIADLANSNINLSQTDWNTQETSWDFKRNPLI